MPIQLKDESGGKILLVHVSGKLAKADYVQFAPNFERRLRQHGKLRVQVDMTGLDGWDAAAFWSDIKFDFKHFAGIERLAMVGNTAWQHTLARLCQSFTNARIRYFDYANAAEARKWLGKNMGVSTKTEMNEHSLRRSSASAI